jgi:hypothetical protein
MKIMIKILTSLMILISFVQLQAMKKESKQAQEFTYPRASFIKIEDYLSNISTHARDYISSLKEMQRDQRIKILEEQIATKLQEIESNKQLIEQDKKELSSKQQELEQLKKIIKAYDEFNARNLSSGSDEWKQAIKELDKIFPGFLYYAVAKNPRDDAYQLAKRIAYYQDRIADATRSISALNTEIALFQDAITRYKNQENLKKQLQATIAASGPEMLKKLFDENQRNLVTVKEKLDRAENEQKKENLRAWIHYYEVEKTLLNELAATCK